MPNARELQRMLNDFQQLVPAIVGAILAVVTAIGVLVAAVKEETPNPTTSPAPGASQPAQKPKEPTPGNTGGNFSKPEVNVSNYLTDQDSGNNYGVKTGVSVTFNGKDYPKSIISTQSNMYYSSEQTYIVPNGYTSLTYDAAWASNIPNEGNTGVIVVEFDGGLRDRVEIKPGESKRRTVDVRGGGRVTFKFTAYANGDKDSEAGKNGLAALRPMLNR